MEQDPRCSRCGLDHEHFVVEPRPAPPAIPVAGPGRPRYTPRPLGLTFWAIPVAIIGATILAILCGALWR